jgi:hypothetical protein
VRIARGRAQTTRAIVLPAISSNSAQDNCLTSASNAPPPHQVWAGRRPDLTHGWESLAARRGKGVTLRYTPCQRLDAAPKIPSLIVLSHVGVFQAIAESSKIRVSASAGSEPMRHNGANCLMFSALDAACHGPAVLPAPFPWRPSTHDLRNRFTSQGPHLRPALRRGFPRR